MLPMVTMTRFLGKAAWLLAPIKRAVGLTEPAALSAVFLSCRLAAGLRAHWDRQAALKGLWLLC